MRFWRELIADHLDAFERRPEIGLPVVEQIIDHGIELLFRRIPGLHQVIIQLNIVDGLDRGVGVRIGGEQHPFSVGKEFPGLLQELYAFHLRHPLIGNEHGDGLAFILEIEQAVEGLFHGGRAQDTIVLPELGAQITGDGAQYLRIIVYNKYDGWCHDESCNLNDLIYPAIGRQTMNSVLPGTEFTFTEPWCWPWTIRITTSRPSPVPLPIPFVVKKGSKMLLLISSGMPGPLSMIEIRANWWSSPVRMMSFPLPWGSMASTALSMRLVHAWLSSPTRAMTLGSVGS